MSSEGEGFSAVLQDEATLEFFREVRTKLRISGEGKGGSGGLLSVEGMFWFGSTV